jgi:hypothetical protein
MVCGDEHVTLDRRGTDQTCATCIGKVRDDLGLIGATRLLGEAVVRGINSQAMVLDGPVARATTYAIRVRRIIDGSACTLGLTCPFHGTRAHGPTCHRDCAHRSCARINAPCPDAVAFNYANRDEPHPTWVVGTWEMKAREHLGQPGEDSPTLTEARDYLNQHLTHLAHDPDFPFEDLGDDLERCRTHFESVLHDGEQIEKGAPCQRCKRPVLRTTGDDGRSPTGASTVSVISRRASTASRSAPTTSPTPTASTPPTCPNGPASRSRHCAGGSVGAPRNGGARSRSSTRRCCGPAGSTERTARSIGSARLNASATPPWPEDHRAARRLIARATTEGYLRPSLNRSR